MNGAKLIDTKQQFMSDLNPGEMAIILAGAYTGTLIVRDCDDRCQMIGKNNGWTGLAGNHLLIRKLEAGDKIEII